MDAMSELWEHSDRALCTHPGWGSLHGWGAIAASFFALFQSGERLQFILTAERAEVDGDLAWVSVDENILGIEAATVSALNLFARDGDRWRMAAHHGSAVMGEQ
jgi:hypothetical protein